MILASIFIGPPGNGEDLVLPPMVRENIESLKRHHPHLPHRLFSGEDILALLEAKFPREVLAAYNALKPNAFKADLARYCILYELGGIYADLAFYFARPVPFDGTRPVVFQDLIWSAPWDTSNSVIAMPPRHAAMGKAVEMVCANVARRYYGPTFLCPTGPALFGQAIANTCAVDDLVVGMSAPLPLERVRKELPDVPLPNEARFHCLAIVGERTTIAIKRKKWSVAGLGPLGAADNDDYRASWHNRDIYEGDAAPEHGSTTTAG